MPEQSKSSSKRKTWKTHPDNVASFSVSRDTVIMQGSKKNFVAITEAGTYHAGKQSFICAPSDIRISGMWVLNDFMTAGIPSTIVTPVSTLKFSPPVSGVANLAETVGLLTSVLF